MSRYGYVGSNEYKPVSAWGYVGYALLFAIPVLGLIMLIIFSISRHNINVRSYARSYWCMILFVVVVLCGLLVMSLASGWIPKDFLQNFSSYAKEYERSIAGYLAK